MAESDVTVLDAPFPRVVFGVGALSRVPEEVAGLGASALLIVDEASVAAGDEVAASLGDRLADRIDGAVMHVPVPVADAATERARAAGVDLVVSIGGGSATGLAKAIALATGLPILAVPTTYAGSEMTPVWGLTGTNADGASTKRTGRDPRVRPRVVVYDPALTVSMPTGLSAASGMNALAHLMAGLFASGTAPIVAAIAEEGVRTLADALPRVVAAPSDLAARSDALYGAWLAGWTFGTGVSGLHHRVCHVLGGSYDLPHAQTHAAMLPYTTAFLAPGSPAGAARAARALGADDPAAALHELARTLGAPTSLTEIGFDPAHIDDVAAAVVAVNPDSPRPVDHDGVRDLLHAACAGEASAA
jgi:maleylacetate reductase